MERFFCSQVSRLAGEDPIGTADPVQTYILIECPLPWSKQAFESAAIPNVLQETVSQIQRSYAGTKPLLIHQDETKNRTRRRIIFYQRPQQDWVSQFDRYEFEVEDLTEASDLIQRFFKDSFLRKIPNAEIQDLLICTHGSRDQCCARYGNPFYVEAQRLVRSRPSSPLRSTSLTSGLASVEPVPQWQVWRTSHFGGHRFAPTAITLPDARCYARLDTFSLKSVLMRSGEISVLSPIYRGSSLLPEPLQILERSLLLKYGWEWMNWPMQGRLQSIQLGHPDRGMIADLAWQTHASESMACRATILPDPDRSLILKASCSADIESFLTQYSLQNLTFSQPETSIAS